MEGSLMPTWNTVGIVENENMLEPHVLQQQYIPEQRPSRQPSDRDLVPSDQHRLVPITDLRGVEE
jgi:hypothetical protein